MRAYRADIDGLRAVAIIFVVLFHNFPDFASGGFIGVDVFFVISGYLITGVITDELRHNEFNFSNFYKRRIKRLFPALIVTIFICLLFGILLLDEVEYRALGLSISAGAFFLQNFLLISQIGYFDWESYFKPLLHLWSLSIEEQFYIFIPVILIFSHRLKIGFKAPIILILLTSLISCIIYSYYDQAFTFYFTPLRIWEILIGSLISQVDINKIDLNNQAKNIISALSITTLISCFFVFKSNNVFPGWKALLPTLATASLVMAGKDTFLSSKILSHRTFVFIGKISYPLYLYHWPLISFARIREGSNPSLIIRWLIISLAVWLAYLTYRHLEKPLRENQKSIIAIILISILFALGLGGITAYKRGGVLFPSFFIVKIVNEGGTDYRANSDYFSKYSFGCDIKYLPKSTKENSLNCGQSKKEGPPEIIILGDSHAQMLFPAIAEIYPDMNVVYATTSVPYKTTSTAPLIEHPLFADLYSRIIKIPETKFVVLNASWMAKKSQLPSDVNLGAELERVAKLLEDVDKKLLIVTDVPNFNIHPARCKYSNRLGILSKCTMPKTIVDQQLEFYFTDFLYVQAQRPEVKILNISYDFCKDAECTMAQKGKLLYFDGGHLSIEGSLMLSKHFDEAFKTFPIH